MMAAVPRKTALIMGVANQRSIAWGCVQSFSKAGWNVVATYQNERFDSKVQSMISKQQQQQQEQQQDQIDAPRIVALKCDAQSDIPVFFTDRLPEMAQNKFGVDGQLTIDAIVHSIGHAPNLKTTPLIDTTLDDFLESQHISSYSFLEVARCASQSSLLPRNGSASLTALTYLGAVRAISGYRAMGPAKASLESIVRGLALEMGKDRIRVNAVSSGPLATVAAKGGIANFDAMKNDVDQRAPLGNITAEQVADTLLFLATKGTGITGQTLYVDGGYSIVAGPETKE